MGQTIMPAPLMIGGLEGLDSHLSPLTGLSSLTDRLLGPTKTKKMGQTIMPAPLMIVIRVVYFGSAD